MIKKINSLLACCLAATTVTTLHAEGNGIEFKGSGFLSLAAGQVIGGTNNDAEYPMGYHGASYVADYANNGVYEKDSGLTIKPETKLGLQGQVKFNDTFSVTGQVVARGSRSWHTNLEWLYGNAKINDKLTLQVGRKRLPLFYYSETQDVGFAYPWVHLPQQLYGWEIVNYNGANLLYQDNFGDWSTTINAFAGNETKKDNGFWKIYTGKESRVDSRWSDIRGAEITASKDWFEGRFVYITSKIANKFVSDGETEFADAKRQHIYGLAFNADYGNWVARSEFQYINRKPSSEEDYGQMYGVGYRFGKFLPMVTYARYKQKLQAPDYVYDDSEGHSTTSLVLRWDVTNSSALKFQIERWRDMSMPNYKSVTPFAGADLISVSYDMVF